MTEQGFNKQTNTIFDDLAILQENPTYKKRCGVGVVCQVF